MDGFGFSLSDNTFLRKDSRGYYLLSSLPLRVLRINEPLFLLLRHIQGGGELEEYLDGSAGLDERSLLSVLLSLAAKGYLRLDRTARIKECPSVSIIIPVRDQPAEIAACLEALARLDYPRAKREIIVVDDASTDEIARLVGADVEVVRLPRPQGASAARNAGAERAVGEILAFLDADCIAHENWLNDLVPFFRAGGIGAVGGYVEGYHHDRHLDRYEAAASPLNLGRRILMEGDTPSSFYVPTANMLVAGRVFRAACGFRTGMHVGEDVDFCWRLRGLGHILLYVPSGRVAHKHRTQPLRMLQRRSQYGTSEAVLYRTHREKKKTFLFSPYAGIVFLALTFALLSTSPYPLMLSLPAYGVDLWLKSGMMRKLRTAVSLRSIACATLRSHLAFAYFALYHLVRYYLILILGLAFVLPSLWLFAGFALLFTSVVDYYAKRPRLLYFAHLLFFIAEHLAYQIGVFWGCLRVGYFGSYRVAFRRF